MFGQRAYTHCWRPLARATGILAGGFLGAVAGCAMLFVLLFGFVTRDFNN